MRKPLLFLLSALGCAAAMPAHADNLSVRGAAYYGLYQIRGYSDPVFFNGFKDSGKSEGLGVGSTYTFGRAFIDLGLDYFQINDGIQGFDFQRTDLSFTGGAKIIDWLGAFGGVRRAWQSPSNSALVDAPFRSSNGWNEVGVFAGPSFGPFALGPIRLSGSVAYNLNWVKGPGANTFFSTDGDARQYNGIGAKLRFGLAKTPHAIELRYQRFANDKPDELDYNESYLYLGYIFNWSLTNK